jgi:mannose/fructose/N-acetylgalactosamine-specific phosphotransferase system component IIB
MAVYLHIDDRLIHGPVTIEWCSYFGIDKIFVVHDAAYADPMQRVLLPQSARSIPTKILTETEGVAQVPVINQGRETTLVVSKHVKSALALMKAGLKPAGINVGNQAFVPSTQYVTVLPWISLTKEEARAFAEIAAMGYKITPQRNSRDKPMDLVEQIQKKGLLSQ